MYCCNCTCAGCSMIPDLVRLRREYREGTRRRRILTDQVTAARNKLTGLTYSEGAREGLSRKVDELGKKLSPVMHATLVDLVRSAEKTLASAQVRVNLLREASDPETALLALAEDQSTTQAVAAMVLSKVRGYRTQIDGALRALEEAKQRVQWQQDELRSYEAKSVQHARLKNDLESFDANREATTLQIAHLDREYAANENTISTIDKQIRDTVRRLRRFHATDRSSN